MMHYFVNGITLLMTNLCACALDLPVAVSVMKLTEQVVRSFRTAKTFKENTDRINNIDISTNGDTLISSSEDDSIVIYDCQNGT